MVNVAPTPTTPLQGLRTRRDVATGPGIRVSYLNFLLHALRPDQRYREFQLRKRGGGLRTIRAPILPIKEAQAKIAVSERFSGSVNLTCALARA
jgi:hypothetical protein